MCIAGKHEMRIEVANKKVVKEERNHRCMNVTSIQGVDEHFGNSIPFFVSEGELEAW